MSWLTALEEYDRDGRPRRFPLVRWALAYAGGFVGAMLDQRRQRR